MTIVQRAAMAIAFEDATIFWQVIESSRDSATDWCRRFEVPASRAASASRNFKSTSGTRATSKSGHRFCVRSRANYRWRMIFSANRRPLRRIMR
ncbi:MAG: hypothetical protein WAK85_22380, partial [Xanthobacteraceae bacterium]